VIDEEIVNGEKRATRSVVNPVVVNIIRVILIPIQIVLEEGIGESIRNIIRNDEDVTSI
jgi:hypothetical protein